MCMTGRPLVIKSCLFDECFMTYDAAIQMNSETGCKVRLGQSMEKIFWLPDHLDLVMLLQQILILDFDLT